MMMKKNLKIDKAFNYTRHYTIDTDYNHLEKVYSEVPVYPTLQDELHPWWVTGITDAEGNFSLNYNSRNEKKTIAFKVTQKAHSKLILDKLKNFFKCGSVVIDNRKYETLKYQVSNVKDINERIIPHFDNYPLQTSKNLDFKCFKKGAQCLTSKSSKRSLHMSSDNNSDVIEAPFLGIKNSMNTHRLNSERFEYMQSRELLINNEWLQAFVEGEGTFYYYLTESNPNASLEICQKSYELTLITAIKDFIGKGYIKPKNVDLAYINYNTMSRLIVRDTDWVIKFFEKFPLFTEKRKDFKDWKELVKLKKDNAHKSRKGLMKMLEIKSGMNVNRHRNYSTYSRSTNYRYDTLEALWHIMSLGFLGVLLVIYFSFADIEDESFTNENNNDYNSSLISKEDNLYTNQLKHTRATNTNLSDKRLEDNNESEDYINEDNVVPLKFNLWDSDKDFNIKDLVERNSSIELVVAADAMNNEEHPPVEEVFSFIDVDYIKTINWYNYIKNNFVQDSRIDMTLLNKDINYELIDKIIKDIGSTEDNNKENLKSIINIETFNESDDVCSDTSSLYEKLIYAIRSGDNVSICNLSDESSSNRSQISVSDSEDIKEESFTEESSEPISMKPKSIVIITKKNEGDQPLPLPSWFKESSHTLSSEEDKIIQERESRIKKFWTSKWPFLPEHYEEANSNLYSENENRNLLEEAFGNNEMEKVFEGKKHKPDIFRDDSIDLDKLFYEHK